jgi:hypothetical protein
VIDCWTSCLSHFSEKVEPIPGALFVLMPRGINPREFFLSEPKQLLTDTLSVSKAVHSLLIQKFVFSYFSGDLLLFAFLPVLYSNLGIGDDSQRGLDSRRFGPIQYCSAWT